MAKDYIKSDIFRLYLNTGTYASPTWAQIKAVSDINVDPAKGDVEIPEQDADTGHLQGNGDPMFTFTLYEDDGDTNVGTMISNLLDGTLTHLAFSAGDITTSGVKYWHMEACMFAPNSLTRGEASSFDVEAKKHANSDYSLVRATVA